MVFSPTLRCRGLSAGFAAALLLAPLVSVVAEDGEGMGYDTILQLQSEKRKQRKRAQKALIEAGDRSLVPGLVDSLFFIPREHRDEALQVLETLTGVDLGLRHLDWVEWVGAHPEIEPYPGYLEFKVELLSRIDPRYSKILYEGVPRHIRLTEVVWGGVRVDEIPTVMNPETMAATEADYLGDAELVKEVQHLPDVAIVQHHGIVVETLSTEAFGFFEDHHGNKYPYGGIGGAVVFTIQGAEDIIVNPHGNLLPELIVPGIPVFVHSDRIAGI